MLDNAAAELVEFMDQGEAEVWWWCPRCLCVDEDVLLATDVSIAELVAVAEERTEQEETDVTVVVTVIAQEAGQSRCQATVNGENAKAASVKIKREGGIVS
jgi:outer membrane cobalamin receptor